MKKTIIYFNMNKTNKNDYVINLFDSKGYIVHIFDEFNEEELIKRGLIVFDDYGTVEGETIAIEEFFKDKQYILHKFPFSHTKPSYIIK